MSNDNAYFGNLLLNNIAIPISIVQFRYFNFKVCVEAGGREKSKQMRKRKVIKYLATYTCLLNMAKAISSNLFDSE